MNTSGTPIELSNGQFVRGNNEKLIAWILCGHPSNCHKNPTYHFKLRNIDVGFSACDEHVLDIRGIPELESIHIFSDNCSKFLCGINSKRVPR